MELRVLKSSIRRQLLSWLLVPLIGLWLIGAAVTYMLGSDFAKSAYDDALVDSARTVESRLRFHGASPVLDLPPAAVAILRHSEKDEYFYQVRTSNGRLISGDDSLPAPAADDWEDGIAVRDGMAGRWPVRIAAVRVQLPGRKGESVVVQVAETLKGRQELAENILLGVVLPQLLLIILSAMAVWFGVKRGLQPLRALQDAVASRSPRDLRPLAEDNAPKEVKPLVQAINELLSRLREDHEAQKRFVANAAHQLRTPLAGLKTQSELAERMNDPGELRHALRQIRTSVDRGTRLVHQLLSLAKVDPMVLKVAPTASVDLNAIVRDVTAEFVPRALHKTIDLGFEGASGDCLINGHKEAIYEMVSNLLDNAINYTQAGGKVTVKVVRGDSIKLVVEDNGPGIAAAERERVFERFYRALGNNVDGSGLGLAIVREIADAHNASVVLNAGPRGMGTGVVVKFPLGRPVPANFVVPAPTPVGRP